jgi:hypothetical protein
VATVSLTVRLESSLKNDLDRFVAMRRLLGEPTTASDIVREALVAYLEGLHDELRSVAREALN